MKIRLSKDVDMEVEAKKQDDGSFACHYKKNFKGDTIHSAWFDSDSIEDAHLEFYKEISYKTNRGVHILQTIIRENQKPVFEQMRKLKDELRKIEFETYKAWLGNLEDITPESIEQSKDKLIAECESWSKKEVSK